MLRTNSKIVKERVRDYIKDNDEYIRELLEYEGKESASYEDVRTCIWDEFIRVMGHEIQHGRKSYQDLFSEYASGLPLGGIFDYHYNIEAVPLVGDMLEETEAERSKYSESDAERLMDYLIFREVARF